MLKAVGEVVAIFTAPLKVEVAVVEVAVKFPAARIEPTLREVVIPELVNKIELLPIEGSPIC